MCQDAGASFNAIDTSTALNANCRLIPLALPIIALVGSVNSLKLVANFIANLTFKYGGSLFMTEYFVLKTKISRNNQHVQSYRWLVLNILDLAWTICQGSTIGKASLYLEFVELFFSR